MKRPPKDAWCDASTGIDYTGKHPKILRCKNKATVVGKRKILGIPVWLCEDCASKVDKS